MKIFDEMNIYVTSDKTHTEKFLQKELSNLGAKKRRPDEDEEKDSLAPPPPTKRATRARK